MASPKKFLIPLPSATHHVPVAGGDDIEADAHAADAADAHIESAVANAATRAGHFTLFSSDMEGSAGVPVGRGESSAGGDSPGEAAASLDTPPGDTAAATTGADGPPARALPAGKGPVCCIVIGMAGSGKTTLMQRFNAEAHMRSLPSYVVNLDPAVAHLPYGANIDIRDTVNYKEVMRTYGLGPNGAIVTSLNLFATRFEQVMALLEKRAPSLKCAWER